MVRVGVGMVFVVYGPFLEITRRPLEEEEEDNIVYFSVEVMILGVFFATISP